MSFTLKCPKCQKTYPVQDEAELTAKNYCSDCEVELKPASADVSAGKAVLLAALRDAPPDVRAVLGGNPELVARKYVIIKKLGQGGMGAVHKAWDITLKRYAALKMILPAPDDATLSEDSVKRFIREAQTSAKLTHPNIMQVYEAGRHSGNYFIAMEYVDGGTLDDYRAKKYGAGKSASKRAGRPEIKEYLALIRQVCEGLYYAHSQNIIHRDIKPENILLQKDSNNEITPKVSDFGLAKEITSNKKLTQTGTVIGTPFYMSPEQAMAGKVDSRSDIFSLGAVLYRLCAGTEPFHGKSSLDVMRAVVSKDPIRPSRLNRAIDRDLEVIILKAMEKDNQRRYQTARELGEDIERYLNGESIKARPPSITYQLTRRLRQNKLAGIGIASAVIILLIVAISSYVSSTRASRKAETYRKEAFQSFEKGRLDDARAACIKLLEVSPEDAEVKALLAKLEKQLKAESDSKEKAQKDAQLATAKLEKAKELRDKARVILDRARLVPMPDQKIKIAREALAIDPSYGDALQEIGLAYKDKQDYDKAVDYFSRAIKAAPTLAYSYYWRAWITEYIWNRPEETIADYEKVLEYDPNGHIGWFAKGYIEYRQQKYDEAFDSYNRALKIFPQYDHAYNHRGAVYFNRNELDKAIADFNNAIRVNPSYADAYNNRGLAYRHKKELDKAIADFTEAIRLNPNSLQARLSRGSSYFDRGEFDNALADFSEALRISPNDAKAYTNRGGIYHSKGDFNSAIADHTAAIRLKPGYAEAYSNRALSYVSRGEFDKAIADCNEAVRLDPKMANAYNNRGLAYYKKNDLTHAIADFSEAIKLNPQNTQSYINRAVSYSQRNNFRAAIADGEAFLKLAPNHPQASQMRQQIKEWQNKMK